MDVVVAAMTCCTVRWSVAATQASAPGNSPPLGPPLVETSPPAGVLSPSVESPLPVALSQSVVSLLVVVLSPSVVSSVVLLLVAAFPPAVAVVVSPASIRPLHQRRIRPPSRHRPLQDK